MNTKLRDALEDTKINDREYRKSLRRSRKTFSEGAKQKIATERSRVRGKKKTA